MNRKLIFAGWFAMLGHITSAQKQDSLQNVIALEEVVITASKIPITQRESAKPVQIIGKEKILRSEGKDLSQLLNEQTGIIVNGAYSNPVKNKNVFIRGASNQYALILLDGIPITDASGLGGAFDLRMIPLQQIERIEILKGSQSTLYGSDAVAGVINVITKSPGEDDFSLAGLIIPQ